MDRKDFEEFPQAVKRVEGNSQSASRNAVNNKTRFFPRLEIEYSEG